MKWFKSNCRNKGGDGRTDERTDERTDYPITIYHPLYSGGGGYNYNGPDHFEYTRRISFDNLKKKYLYFFSDDFLFHFQHFCVACVAGSTHRDHFVRRPALSCVVPHLHYPQLLLNGWIDFNETFQNSFTHIADVHLLFCFLVFKFFVKFWSFLDFVKQAEKGGGWALSATPPKWLNRFQWNFPKFFYTYCRCAPPILFSGF